MGLGEVMSLTIKIFSYRFYRLGRIIRSIGAAQEDHGVSGKITAAESRFSEEPRNRVPRKIFMKSRKI